VDKFKKSNLDQKHETLTGNNVNHQKIVNRKISSNTRSRSSIIPNNVVDVDEIYYVDEDDLLTQETLKYTLPAKIHSHYNDFFEDFKMIEESEGGNYH